jgi:UDP-N-acetyl-D-glucosamine dehydrogenase
MNQHHHTLSAKIDDRSVKVGIIGMGYVGLPLMLAATANRLSVLGFDINEARVAELNVGKSPLKHIPGYRIFSALESGLFEATSSFERLDEVDVVVICVPTPLGKHREPDLSFVKTTTESIAARLRPGQLIVLESTSYPGTTREVILPILEATGLRSGEQFFLAFSPEREDPGNTKFSTSQIPRIVGGDDEATLSLASKFYAAFVDTVIPVGCTTTAEAVKITENVFRAVNIALVNELKVIYSKLGINIFDVIEAAKTKPFGYMPFYPGPGLGGHCIPIDPFYLTWKAREARVNTRFVELAGEINSQMPQYVVDRTAEVLDSQRGCSLSRARVLLIGIAYKRDVDDTRESPGLAIIELLQRRGASVDYHDPFIGVIPKTREHAGLAGMKSVPLTERIVSQYDVVVIVTDHTEINWERLVDAAGLIVDTRNVTSHLKKGRHKIFAA